MAAYPVLSTLVFVVLLLLSAFFSSSETALIASGRVKLNHLAAQGSRGASRALKLVEQPSDLLATILVGNNLVNVMAAALATVLVGPVYATLAVTLALLIFGEITPKTLAAARPEKFAIRVAAPVEIFGVIFRPVVWVAASLVELMLWPFRRGGVPSERRLSRGELLTAIRLGARDGELEPSETRMTQEILALKDLPVRRIMIPLSEVDAIPESANLEEVLTECARSGNTRYPVLRGDPPELVGMLLVKDLIVHREGMVENWRQYVRPLMRCRPDLEADELLRDMQLQRSHMVAVEDAQEKFLGLVTMEDVLEEIVGEIQDEYDDEEAERIREISPGRYSVHGGVEVDDLCKVINVDLGRTDPGVTLAEWFERRAGAAGGSPRRVKLGPARVVQHRHPNRFDIWLRGHSGAEAVAGGDAPRR